MRNGFEMRASIRTLTVVIMVVAIAAAAVSLSHSGATGTVPPARSLNQNENLRALAGIDKAVRLLRAHAGSFPVLEGSNAPSGIKTRLSQLASARRLVELSGGDLDPQARGFATAAQALLDQAEALGSALPDQPTTFSRQAPSDAILSLAGRYGVSVSDELRTQSLELDTLGHPLARTLSGYLQAFLNFDAASRSTFANPDQAAIEEDEITGRTLPQLFGHLPDLLIARSQMLAASRMFTEAVQIPSAQGRTAASMECDPALPNPLTIPLNTGAAAPMDALAIDLSGCPTTYSRPAVVSIDVGGDDIYNNNAGGARLNTPDSMAASALLDLAGNDRYENNRGSGVNGGGSLASGFLLDVSGSDHYLAPIGQMPASTVPFPLFSHPNRPDGNEGANGGAYQGSATLIDLAGNDEYRKTSGTQSAVFGVNGGAVRGVGALVDMQGNDTYFDGESTRFIKPISPFSAGTNGGSYFFGAGLLVDMDGDDNYDANDSAGANGGSYVPGNGLLLDAGGGTDRYLGNRGIGVNGGGAMGYSGNLWTATGSLIDLGGDDYYEAQDAIGANGGAGDLHSGFLLDSGGKDDYITSGDQGLNGGSCTGNCAAATGVFAALVDLGGTGDFYRDDYQPLYNGSGIDKTVVPKGMFIGIQFDSSICRDLGAPDELCAALVVPDIPSTLSISDVAQNEGSTATSQFEFTVSLSAEAAAEITVDFATQDGTAASPADFAATSGTLTFAPGEKQKTIPVTVVADTQAENPEHFSVNLSNASGATLAKRTGTGLIQNDDVSSPTSLLTIDDVVASEGVTGDGTITEFKFNVTLTPPRLDEVKVDYLVSEGTASEADGDYLDSTTPMPLVFAPGDTTKEITVPVVADNTPERDEFFQVYLTNNQNSVVAKAQGIGVIKDDDGGNAPPAITVTDVVQNEGKGGGTTFYDFTVTLTAPSGNQPVSVRYFTTNGTAEVEQERRDYFAAQDTLTFAPGETQKTIRVFVVADDANENTEFFQLYLTDAVNAVTAKYQAVGVIVNDDGNPVPII